MISPKHTLYGRYFSDAYKLAAFFDPHDILVTSTTGNDEHAQTFVLGDTYTLNPTTVNSLHLTVGRRRNDRGTSPNGINAASLGVANFYQATKNFLQLSVNNGGGGSECERPALGRI